MRGPISAGGVSAKYSGAVEGTVFLARKEFIYALTNFPLDETATAGGGLRSVATRWCPALQCRSLRTVSTPTLDSVGAWPRSASMRSSRQRRVLD